MTKLCPFRFGGSPGSSANCVRGHCAFWNDGECAVVKIAKYVYVEEENNKK